MADVNNTTYRSIYPSATGASVAQNATGAITGISQTGSRVPQTDAPDPVSRALSIGGQASPVKAGLILAAMLIGFMFLAKRLGTDDDFRSIRPTVYNGLTISAIVIIFMPIWKYLFTRFPVPGASTWVLAA